MIAQAEIFADIRRRRYQAEENGWTAQEYADNLGIAESTGRRQVRDGVKNGTIRRVGRKPFASHDGRVSWLPVYLFVTDATQNAKTHH